MPDRVRLVVIGFFACAVAALGGVWIAALTSSGDEPQRLSFTPFSGYVRNRAPVPGFSLRDQDGTITGPQRGKFVVYAFIYSHCQDSCPAEVQAIRYGLDKLGHDVPVYGITVDPAHDTAASAKAFLVKQHMAGRMTYLLGTRAQLMPVWKGFAQLPQTTALDHSAGVVVADPAGRQRLFYPAAEFTGSGLAADLRRLGA